MITRREIPVAAGDGHRWELIATLPDAPDAALLWLPALGVPARHYQPLADALAARGIAVFLHEWRGIGSSNLRAGRECDWGYREILRQDLPSSHAALAAHVAAGRAVIGGHSIGAQFAACYLGLHRQAFARLWLVASGSPYWRNFPAPRRYLFPLAFQFVPWLADRRGLLHGRRLGFAGNEARTLMREWAGVGLSNRYTAAGLHADLEQALAGVEADTRAVLLREDWFAPPRSLQALLDKMPRAAQSTEILDRGTLGTRADHFAWMQRPQAVVDTLLRGDQFEA
jgi:predicted alpha/beta hydrolase